MVDEEGRKAGFRPKGAKPAPQIQGQMKGKKPSKKQILNEYQKQVEQLQQAMGQVMNIAMSGDQRLAQELAVQQKWMERTAFTLDALLEHVGVTKETLQPKIDELWIKDFNKGAAEDDETRKLISLPKGTKARSGDVMTAKLEVFNEKDKELTEASRLRVRFNIGRAEFSPEFDNQLIGMTAGEAKEFELTMPPMSGFAGKKLKFKVAALELKTLPVKSPQPPTSTKEQ